MGKVTEKLRQRLVAKWRINPGVAEPLIYLLQNGEGYFVYVVWDAWSEFDNIERAEVVTEAFEEVMCDRPPLDRPLVGAMGIMRGEQPEFCRALEARLAPMSSAPAREFDAWYIQVIVSRAHQSVARLKGRDVTVELADAVALAGQLAEAVEQLTAALAKPFHEPPTADAEFHVAQGTERLVTVGWKRQVGQGCYRVDRSIQLTLEQLSRVATMALAAQPLGSRVLSALRRELYFERIASLEEHARKLLDDARELRDEHDRLAREAGGERG